MNTNKEFTPEEKKAFAAKKRNELKETYKLADETAEKIFTRSQSPADLVKLLDIYSSFSFMGINNALLIFAQYPNAKEIHPAAYWNEHNFRAKKGQHSFLLIEKGDEYTRKDGKKGISRNTVRYFDISQTTAPFRQPETTKYASHTLIKSLLKSCPVKYESYNENNNSGTLSDYVLAKYLPDDRKIIVKKDLPFEQFFIHFSTVLAMAMLDRGGDFKTNERLYLFDAKCISYLLCKKYNIDCSTFDFDDIPDEYMNYDTARIKSKLYEISEINKNINEKMYKSIQSVLKEYQKTANAEQIRS